MGTYTSFTAAICAASLLLGGCVASVQEVRVFGVSRPALGAEAFTVHERTGSPDRASCRTVVTTTRAVREVEIRRSFANPRAQETNAALAMLIGIGSAFVAFDAAKVACQTDTGTCPGVLSSATWPIAAATAALAAIPLAFVIGNAVRVQDDVHLEPAPAMTEIGPWRACEAGEAGGTRAADRPASLAVEPSRLRADAPQ